MPVPGYGAPPMMQQPGMMMQQQPGMMMQQPGMMMQQPGMMMQQQYGYQAGHAGAAMFQQAMGTMFVVFTFCD